LSRHRKHKPSLKTQKFQYRINQYVRVPQVRLVGDNVEQGIYATRKARQIAESLDLDLVEIAPKADPPVCRIIDYSKFLYEKKRKEKEIKAKTVKTIIKEIRFTSNTDDHDFEFKAKHAMRFLEEGAKVKCYVQFKGRGILFKDRGELLLLRFAQRLEELGLPEQLPQMEGKRMFMFIAPRKKNKKPKPKTNKNKYANKTKPAPKPVPKIDPALFRDDAPIVEAKPKKPLIEPRPRRKFTVKKVIK